MSPIWREVVTCTKKQGFPWFSNAWTYLVSKQNLKKTSAGPPTIFFLERTQWERAISAAKRMMSPTWREVVMCTKNQGFPWFSSTLVYLASNQNLEKNRVGSPKIFFLERSRGERAISAAKRVVTPICQGAVACTKSVVNRLFLDWFSDHSQSQRPYTSSRHMHRWPFTLFFLKRFDFF